jgi:glycerate dehydrogenase
LFLINHAVFLDLSTIDRNDIQWSSLERLAHQWEWHQTTSPEQLADRIADADLVISNKVVLDRTVLAACKNLKLICIAATGTNNVDLEAAKEFGIAVTNVTGYGTASVVQHVFSLILSLITKQRQYQEAILAGEWQRSSQFCLLDYPIWELAGKRMGIVGYGELGRAVGQVAEAFGMQLLVAQRPGGKSATGRLPLDELLTQVDVLSLHVPLAENTRHLIGERELALMQSHALLINTARGGIVDESALATALKNGELGGAGMDVLTREPPVEGNPLLDATIPNLIVTPHIAWASREARQRLVGGVVDNITGYLSGTDLNRVV